MRLVEPDAAHRDHGLLREPARPRGEIAVRAGKRGLPESPRARMENIHAGLGKRSKKSGQLVRRRGDPRVVVGHLPLREAEDDRKAGRHHAAHRAHHLDGEAHAILGRPAIGVVAAVGHRPEELIQQVTVCGVDLHAVETDALGVGCRPRVGRDHVLDIARRHRADEDVPLARDGDGTDTGNRGVRSRAWTADRADMPQLRHDHASRCVHGFGDAAPSGERRGAEERGHIGIAVRGWMVDDRSLGHDQPDAALRAACVIRRHRLARYARRRPVACHRRHHDPIAKGPGAERHGLEQDLQRERVDHGA